MGKDYKSHVGTPSLWDKMGKVQFDLLKDLGLQPHHYLLDIGCGGLRAGKLFIPYLDKGHYFGTQPDKYFWAIEDGIKGELPEGLCDEKEPVFINDGKFNVSTYRKGHKEYFDFILAQSIFSHAAQWQIKSCLTDAHKAMHADSLFVASFYMIEFIPERKGRKAGLPNKQPTPNYEGKSWSYPSCVNYTWDFMKDLVRECGFEFAHLNWPHPNDLTWALICYRKSLPKLLRLDILQAMRG